MGKKVIAFYLIFLLFASVFPLSTSYEHLPATVYVDDDYNPTTPGWNVTRFDNVQDGIDAVDVGGTVTVYAGTYDGFTVNKEATLVGDRSNVFVDGGGSGIVVNFSNNDINMSGFTIRNGDTGLLLHSDWNIVFLCKFIDNDDYGISFYESDNNTIYYNDFIDNDIGMELFLFDDFDNLIYNNNFLNCSAIDDYPGFEPTRNRWNETYGTYPGGIIGGNYWYDHMDFTDVMHGPNQDLAGGDGIVDTNYTCGRTGLDYYPLMEWYYPPGANTPPVISDEDPLDTIINVDVTQPDVSVLITDDGTFDWTIEGDYITSASGTGETTGRKYANASGTFPYFTIITWYVNVTDGEFDVNDVFTFRTVTSLGGTIQEAIDDADPYDIINIPSGIYNENIIINKSITLQGEDKNTTIVDGGGIEIFHITEDDVKIDGLTIQNGDNGIEMISVEDVEITGCIIKDNPVNGIYMSDANSCLISGNEITDNDDGIHCYGQENTIEYNTIHENINNGTVLVAGAYNIINGNLINRNGNNGMRIEESGDMVIGNTITTNHLHGVVAVGYLSPLNNSLTVSENVIHSNWAYGILIMGYEDSIISNNNVSGNDGYGISIVDSFSIEIYENDIYGYNWQYSVPNYQQIGLILSNSPLFSQGDNFIYHNNFFDNQLNARDTTDNGNNFWNDSYPSGGNYWSDFHNDSQGAFDHYRGHYQSIGGVDGIVDSHSLNPYNLTGGSGSQDWYPLRNPYLRASLVSTDFTWTPRIPRPHEQVNFTSLAEGGTLVAWQWDFGDGQTGTGRTPTHNYTAIGYYVVRLRTLNDRGLSDTSVQTLFVAPRGVFIPDPQKNKYPGFTVDEMYMLLKAKDLPNSDSKIIVFVIDSGVYPAVYKDVDLTKITSLYPKNFFSSGTDAIGHGTWCNYAVAVMLKKLPNAQQISYRIFGPEGETTNEMLIQAFEVARQMHADVVSLSAGAVGNPNDAFSHKVAELRSEGIIVICAGGNFGPQDSSILSPACSRYAIAIAGSDPQWYEDPLQKELGIKNLADDTISTWSSRGPVPNVYPKPDVTSPGESILGPWIVRGVLVEQPKSGTSMATPLIAGGTAVVIAENKDLIEQVKLLNFWDKGVVVTLFEESLRESCYAKGDVNDWGAGIVQFDKVSELYRAKLMKIVAMDIGSIMLLIILIIILIIYLYYRSRKNKRNPWEKWNRR